MLQGFNFFLIKLSLFKVDLTAYQNLTTFNCTTDFKYLQVISQTSYV